MCSHPPSPPAPPPQISLSLVPFYILNSHVNFLQPLQGSERPREIVFFFVRYYIFRKKQHIFILKRCHFFVCVCVGDGQLGFISFTLQTSFAFAFPL